MAANGQSTTTSVSTLPPLLHNVAGSLDDTDADGDGMHGIMALDTYRM